MRKEVQLDQKLAYADTNGLSTEGIVSPETDVELNYAFLPSSRNDQTKKVVVDFIRENGDYDFVHVLTPRSKLIAPADNPKAFAYALGRTASKKIPAKVSDLRRLLSYAYNEVHTKQQAIDVLGNIASDLRGSNGKVTITSDSYWFSRVNVDLISETQYVSPTAELYENDHEGIRSDETDRELHYVFRSDNERRFIPWSHRSKETWERKVAKREAARLFYLAFRNEFVIEGNSGVKYPSRELMLQYTQDLPSYAIEGIIATWDLQTPLEVFWNGRPNEMLEELSELVTWSDDSATPDTGVSLNLTQILSSPDIYEGLLSMRKDRTTNGDRKRDEGLAAISGYSSDEVLSAYHKIIELFYPLAQRIARRRSERSILDDDDWNGLAGVFATQSASYFFWDTAAIDPEWTSNLYKGYLSRTIHDSSLQDFDALHLEVSTEMLTNYGSTDTTAESVLNNNSKDNVMLLIASNVTTEREFNLLYSFIFEGYSIEELAEEFEIEKEEVLGLVSDFRDAVGVNGLTDVELVANRTKGKKPRDGFWNDLWENLEKYRKAFQRKGRILKDYHYEVANLFFSLQTGDKDSTIDLVWAHMLANGHNVQRQSVRRGINAAINQLNSLEPITPNAWDRYQRRVLIQQAYQDPAIWSGFSSLTQQILTLGYLTGNDERVYHSDVAKDLGINQSTVMRHVERAIQTIYRVKGSIVVNPGLVYKPRHHLPQ